MWYGPNPWRRHRPRYPSRFFWILIIIGAAIIITHEFWLIITIAVIGAIIYRNIRKSMKNQHANTGTQQTYYQSPQQHTTSQTQTPSYYTPPQPAYQPYDRGYQSNQRAYQPQSQLYPTDQYEAQEQKPATSYDEYDQPKAEYPQLMPPM
jgi:hypothetical protein